MESGRTIAKFFGGLLIVVGSIMAICCGLCTGYVGIMGLGEIFQNPRTALDDAPILLVGIIPTAIGVGLFLAGRRLYRD